MTREFDPDSAPRSALGDDQVIFQPPQRSQDHTGVHMSQPTRAAAVKLEQTNELKLDPSKKYEYKKPSAAEELKAYKDLFFQLNMARTITLDNNHILEILKRIDGFVGSHGDGNGERTEQEIQQNINRGYWKFMVGDEKAGIREVVEKKPVEKKAVTKKKKPARKRVVKPAV